MEYLDGCVKDNGPPGSPLRVCGDDRDRQQHKNDNPSSPQTPLLQMDSFLIVDPHIAPVLERCVNIGCSLDSNFLINLRCHHPAFREPLPVVGAGDPEVPSVEAHARVGRKDSRFHSDLL